MWRQSGIDTGQRPEPSGRRQQGADVVRPGQVIPEGERRLRGVVAGSPTAPGGPGEAPRRVGATEATGGHGGPAVGAPTAAGGMRGGPGRLPPSRFRRSRRCRSAPGTGSHRDRGYRRRCRCTRGGRRSPRLPTTPRHAAPCDSRGASRCDDAEHTANPAPVKQGIRLTRGL